MSAVNFSDEQLDDAASRYAVAHRVPYAEALRAVASKAQFSEASPARHFGPGPDGEVTESQIHCEAMAHHLAKNVSYMDALRVVVASHAVLRGRVAAVAQGNQSPDADKQLHAKAVSYAEANSVSYREALGAVVESAAPGGAQQALEDQPIAIFRAGTHADTKGVSRMFTVEDVRAMASVYDPALHEAPLTIGHPEDDMPAQGWVNGLTATDDGVLMMRARKVAPAFAADVSAGRFLKRSASFYPPDAPNNPAPGRWYLRHVAWLGAMPPAVKGLPDVNFGASDPGLCFVF